MSNGRTKLVKKTSYRFAANDSIHKASNTSTARTTKRNQSVSAIESPEAEVGTTSVVMRAALPSGSLSRAEHDEEPEARKYQPIDGASVGCGRRVLRTPGGPVGLDRYSAWSDL